MNNNDLDEIETELKEQELEEEKTGQRISGRSVFTLQEIIKEKASGGKDDQEKSHKED